MEHTKRDLLGGMSSEQRGSTERREGFLWKRLREEWKDAVVGESWLGRLALGHALLGVVCLVLMRLDTRMLLGLNVWVKPSKFAFSIATFLFTVMWLLVRLELTERERSRVRWVVFSTMLLEMLVIGFQAARGVRSHFNFATFWDGAMFSAMGVAIVLNTVIMAQLAWWSSRRRHPALGPILSSGVRWGLWIFVIGSLVGGVMSGMFSHSVGVADGGPGLPYVGWSVRGGDLRIAHFVGLHAIQVLPLWAAAVLWMDHHRSKGPSIGWVRWGGVMYAALVVGLLVWALRGLPLLAL